MCTCESKIVYMNVDVRTVKACVRITLLLYINLNYKMYLKGKGERKIFEEDFYFPAHIFEDTGLI